MDKMSRGLRNVLGSRKVAGQRDDLVFIPVKINLDETVKLASLLYPTPPIKMFASLLSEKPYRIYEINEEECFVRALLTPARIKKIFSLFSSLIKCMSADPYFVAPDKSGPGDPVKNMPPGFRSRIVFPYNRS